MAEESAKKLSKAGIKSLPEALTDTSSGDTEVASNDFISLLKKEFFTPFLSLLTVYLLASNGNKKTSENCMGEFRKRHKKWLAGFLALDMVFKILYLLVVLFVVVRGLGIIEFFKGAST